MTTTPMTTTPMVGDRQPRLGQLLVARGWITGEQLLRAIQSQRAVGGRLGTCLLEMNVLDEERLLEVLASQLATPPVRIEQLRAIDPNILALVPPRVAERCQVVPFSATAKELEIATLDVLDLALLDEIAFCANRRVRPHIANEARVYEALGRYYGFECPKRYEQLLDRLNRTRYLWGEQPDGDATPAAAGDVEWRRPEDVFGELALPALTSTGPAPGVITARSGLASNATPARDLISLRQVEQAFAAATGPDEVGRALVPFLAQSFSRCALLKTTGQDSLRGWLGAGDGLDPARLERFEIGAQTPSVFGEVSPVKPFYCGPLAPIPAHRELIACWGGELPADCVLMAVSVRTHLACVIYGDRGARGLSRLRRDALLRLAIRAGDAFERCILSQKGASSVAAPGAGGR